MTKNNVVYCLLECSLADDIFCSLFVIVLLSLCYVLLNELNESNCLFFRCKAETNELCWRGILKERVGL